MAHAASTHAASIHERALRLVEVPHEWEDLTLAQRLMEKHPAAARVAWDRFSPMVRRMVRRSLGPGHDVEDVVQDVFICLFKRIATLREPQAFKGFLIGITVRTVRYFHRRAKLRRWVRLPQMDSGELGVVHADGSARRALIQFYGVLDRLNERDRTAFVLRFIEGMDSEEVARALGVSVPTARRCFTRARDRVAFHAERDPFLVGYLNGPNKAETAASPDLALVWPELSEAIRA